MGRLDGKVALISGAARGQGAVEGRMFAREGAAVVLGDIQDDDGKKVEAEIRDAGARAGAPRSESAPGSRRARRSRSAA